MFLTVAAAGSMALGVMIEVWSYGTPLYTFFFSR